MRALKLRGLALTGNRRAKVLPDLPTFAEAGLPAYDVHGFYGLLAPQGTPTPIILRMQQSIAQAVKDPAVQFQLGEPVGATTLASSPAEFAAWIRQESERWGGVIRANDIKIQ